MDTFKSIYWHQGLFLKPHHFQHLHAQQEQEIYRLREQIQSFFWGLSSFEIDKKELLNKNITFGSLELIFMDGTFTELSNNAVIASRRFDQKDEVLEGGLKVYIGLKTFSKNGKNVTEVDTYDNLEEIKSRFVVNLNASTVNNLYHTDEPAEIQFIEYALKIFFEDEIENLNGYQVIPVAVIKKEGEQILLSETFVPPLLDIKANKTLFEILKMIQKDLTSHVIQLQEYKLPSSVLLEEPNYLKYVMALQSLSPFVLRFNDMMQRENIHPHKYYKLLLELVALLSTFSNRVDVFGKLENGKNLMREYNHIDIYPCFYDAKLLIKELLDVIIIGPDYIFSFVKNETTYSLDCPVSIFHANYRYFLVLKTPTNKEKLVKDFSEFAKIASSSEIDTIVERSLVGLEFRSYNMPIQGLPQREDSSYYELVTEGIQWGHIQQSQNITIEFDEALEDVSIELIVLKN